ncbi:hypothetical protein [Nocardia wallacei]|uniref:hypothetical protein n=1 Tax=Nocardia wallacei TaxID=480035 RepID=UPI0024549801|nr:hypothetical protein [Nocardia wallacei]
MSDYDTREIIALLGLSADDNRIVGLIAKDGRRLADTECDNDTNPAAVAVDYTVNDPDEGFVATDVYYCADCARDEVKALTEFDQPASPDHDIAITVSYWAVRYGLFADDPAPLPQVAA